MLTAVAALLSESAEEDHPLLDTEPQLYIKINGALNLPFSEWPQVFTNARLCKAVPDRLTDQAHIIETGAESYRFRRTLGKKRKM